MQAPIRSDIEALIKLAHTGDSSAQYNLAQTYYLLDSVKLAFHWWSKSARQRNPEALYKVAQFLRKPESKIAAYLSAAEAGSARAQWSLGIFYKFGGNDYGLEIEADETMSLNWYRKSAEQNYPSALWGLADDYRLNGDFKTSTDYYEKAFWALHEEHQELVGRYHLETGKPAFEEKIISVSDLG
jgi:uncharacterized protein